MKETKLQKILRNHARWLEDKRFGIRELEQLHGAQLRGAQLQGAQLHGADLQDADLQGAQLHGADLRDADLWGAQLRGVCLQGARLQGADLREATGIVSVGPVGKEGRIVYIVDHGDKMMIQAGCFWGDEFEFAKAVTKKYGPGSSYLALVYAACRELEERR